MRFDKTSIYDASFLGVILIEGGLFVTFCGVLGLFSGLLQVICAYFA